MTCRAGRKTTHTQPIHEHLIHLPLSSSLLYRSTALTIALWPSRVVFGCCLVVSTSAIYYLERLVPEMTWPIMCRVGR